MTNKTALWFAAAIILVVAIDYAAFGGQLVVYLGRKLIELTEYVAFWR